MKQRVKCWMLLSFIAVLTGTSAWAQPKLLEKVEAAPGEAKIAYEKYELSNGLTVYIHEDKSDPIVHVEMTYKVGSNREHIGLSGFAHFFEHMMFQGSKNVDDEEHIKIIESSGGRMNGTTNEDRTNYFQTLPSNMLETALWLEADRMGWLIPAVTQEKFEIQRSAVKNEKEQNVSNRPYALAFSELYLRDLYPQGHPYSWPVIGYVEDLDRVNVEDLKKFFLRWYGPNNAVLVIAGDVDSKKTIELVDKYFGTIPRGQEVKPLRVELNTLQQDIFRTYYDRVQLPVITAFYPSVPNYHRDEAALDVLAEVLGSGRNSIFYQSLVKTDFALDVNVNNPCKELAGEFRIQIVPHPSIFYTLDPGKLQTMVDDSVKAILKRFDPLAVSNERLNSIKTGFETNFINVLESVQGKATTLTSWDKYNTPEKSLNIQYEIDRYKAVTQKDLKRVFDKYIMNRGCLNMMVYPAARKEDQTKSVHPYPGQVDEKAEKDYDGLTYKEPESKFDRSKQPVPPTAKPVMVPKYAKKELANGLKVIHTKQDELPKTTMVFNIAGGKLMEAYNPKLLGLASVTAAMMNEGTTTKTAEELSAQLDKIGSSINFSSGGNSTTVVVTSLTKNLDATLKLLEDMLFNPAFKKEDLKRVIEATDQSIRANNKNPGSLGSRAFNALVYGDNILASSASGYLNTISKISVDDVRAFYNKYYAPNITNLTVVGNLTIDELMPKLSFLNNWQKKEVKMPEVNNFPAFKGPAIYIVDLPGAAQSQIFVGKMATTFDFDGDYTKLNIANYSLGGSFNSRINLNLREDKGFTYGANSFVTGSSYPGFWMLATSVKVSATDSALAEISKELNKFYSSGLTPDELNTTKRSLNQADALNYETSFSKAGFLNMVLQYNLPENYTDIQTKMLETISIDDLNAVTKKYLNPQEMIIVVVGDASDIKAGLKRLNLGKVVSVDPEKVKVLPAK